jgi:hypothetical protein
METIIEINECKEEKDYFPALFTNKDNTIVILADARTSQKTFSGMIIHTDNKARLTNALGKYDTGWTYLLFHRLPKHSTVNIAIEQND